MRRRVASEINISQEAILMISAEWILTYAAREMGAMLTRSLLTGELDSDQPIYVSATPQPAEPWRPPVPHRTVTLILDYGVRRDESHDLAAAPAHTAPDALEGQKALGSSHFTGIDLYGMRHEGDALNVRPAPGCVVIEYRSPRGALVQAEFSPTGYKLGA